MKTQNRESIHAPDEYKSPVGMCVVVIVAFVTYIVVSAIYNFSNFLRRL